ncbi:MATA-HMG [Gigaspora margarita]|uniref:MATA-HMG n=1 Tax=Gigaspora margarita TaxID=4874 RepID=A0A8H4EV43_GIGMA|nr:MATA-HMG [Gigaspora margarita]
MMSSQNGPNSFYQNSLNNDFFGNSSYELTLGIEELISPPQNTRCAVKHRKNKSSPPRPLNKFLLFRRDFIAKQKENGRTMNIEDMSRLASYEWGNLTDDARRYFEILEQMAKDKHREMYKGYSYCPKKNKGKESKSKRKNIKTGQSIIQFEKTNQIASVPSEPTSETAAIETVNLTEHNHSESPNFGLLIYDELFLFDSSTGLLPLDLQDHFGINNNFDQESSTSFYQQPNVNF